MLGCGSYLDKGPKVLFCKRLLLGRCVSLNINIEIVKPVILPVILCGCKNWSLKLRDEGV
jgi:hypothetical protein